MRGLEPGPINAYPGWQALGRTVKRGERIWILCMLITRKVRGEQAARLGLIASEPPSESIACETR